MQVVIPAENRGGDGLGATGVSVESRGPHPSHAARPLSLLLSVLGAMTAVLQEGFWRTLVMLIGPWAGAEPSAPAQ